MKHKIIISCIFLVFILQFPFPIFGQEDEGYYLSLEETTRLALENNFDVQIATYDKKIAQQDKGVAESIYDTILSAQAQYGNDQSARTTTLLGTKIVNNDYNVGLQKKLPTGTTVDLEMTNNRNWTNSPFVTSSPSHDSRLGVSVTQELGQNFLGIQDRGGVKITKIDIENAAYTSLDKIEQSLSDTQKAYWDLVLAQKQLQVERDMAARAKKLYDLNAEKIKDGLIESPELYASEANYKSRLNEIQIAENNLQTKMNTLRLLLNISDDNIQISPKDKFAVGQKDIALAPALKNAFEQRRDYQKSLNDIRAKDIRLSMKKNRLWPEVNLTASFNQNGLGDHFKQAVTNISDENNPEIYAGITFSFPLENTKARAEFSKADLEKAKALVRLKLVERTIAIEVKDQVRTCNIYRQVTLDDEKIVELQKKKLSGEEERFSYGRSNVDTLIRFQEDLLSARLKAAQSQYQYQAALVDLKQKTASLLNDYWEDNL